MNKKGQIVEVLSSSSVYAERENLNLSSEADYLSNSQKRQYSLFDGILVGEHDGWSNFKLGQRKGINVGGKKKPLYVIGINKKENRNFSLDRITSLKISDNKFTPFPFNVIQYYEHAFGVETYEPAQKIILNFTAFQSKYIKTLPLHSSQELIYEDETNCHFSYFMHPTHDFVMEILKYGEEVTVVSPDSLKQNLRERILNMAALYQ